MTGIQFKFISEPGILLKGDLEAPIEEKIEGPRYYS